MIDYFTIALTHALLAILAWRLLSRADLDSEGDIGAKARHKPWLKGQSGSREEPGSDA